MSFLDGELGPGPALLVALLVAIAPGLWTEFRVLSLNARLRAAESRGDPSDALKQIRLAERLGCRRNPDLVNLAVNALITLGRYRDALVEPPPVDADSPGAALNRTLIAINLAEAEYNLGHWDAAWERLARLDEAAAEAPICRAGLAQQRAWIAVHTGRASEALAYWQDADPEGLPAAFHAEHAFTEVVIRVALGDLEAAEQAALRGAEAAIRLASHRNALFIQAQVAHARDKLSDAESLCRAGAEHPFRTQGGVGLRLWGDILVRLNRVDEAIVAYELALLRDPESESATQSAQRLQELGVSTPAAV